MATVAISGASGALGTALAAALRARGDTVRAIRRAELAALDVSGCDAIVNLAGEPIAQRWTKRVRRALKESRVRTTVALAEACARAAVKPRALLSGSAIGIYGDRADEILGESSALGNDYLAEVGRAWEAATAPAERAGVRTVHLRTGIVLFRDGGALGKMLLPFRFGLGGRMGAGTQWMSWIARTDWVQAVLFLLDNESVRGPVNLVAPNPVTNAKFAKVLGRTLHRPAVCPVPAGALKLLFGEMAQATVLASQLVSPGVLERAGFRFAHPTLERALQAELLDRVETETH